MHPFLPNRSCMARRATPPLGTASLTIRSIAVLITLSALGASPAIAQTDGNTAAAWRASSRLGYGPSAALVQAALDNPKAWAVRQVDAAYAASQRPPAIPADIARFNQSLGETARDFKAEREAKKNIKELASQPQPSAMSPNMAGAVVDPIGFSREMQRDAMAWRLMACSDPAMENPLLARMTEFWFNHLKDRKSVV